MRTPIVAGNWKMNKTAAEGIALVRAMMTDLVAIPEVQAVFCPPFLAVPDVARLIQGSPLAIGAQDIYWEESGAYTGEVSSAMVAEFCQYVIIGHSERREYFSETDQEVNKKVKAALAQGLIPIVCVGETLALRDEGRTETWVRDQVVAALQNVSAEETAGLVIAYEPIWAIGTGRAATPDDAEQVCGEVVRATIADLYDRATAEAVRIQYGGSVNPGNAEEIMIQPNIDGGLVGGASLQAESFTAIVRSTASAKGLI
jgi:triosephosphate isomerase (TIM)